MTILLVLFGILFGCFLPIIIGILGSKRNIGFTLAFLLSVILTPFVGLVFTLISDEKPKGSERNYGCLGSLFISVVFAIAFLFAFGTIILFMTSLIAFTQ